MDAKPVRIPGPDHPITIVPNPGRVVVTLAGHVIADTGSALTLREAAYPPVQYIPRKDIDMSQLVRTSHATYCPYKGECAYYSIVSPDGTRAENAAWTYEAPHDAVAAIKERIAFYPDRVEVVSQGGEAAGASS
jgi:uncharacterized protein (DUF427 family)